MELYYAFDFAPYSTGFIALKAGERWGVGDFFERVEGYGIPQDICSFRRLQLGMSLEGRFLPPDFMVNTNVYCVAQPKEHPDGPQEVYDYFRKRKLGREEFHQELQEYYRERGWDEATGIPTVETLRRLGLDREADCLTDPI